MYCTSTNLSVVLLNCASRVAFYNTPQNTQKNLVLEYVLRVYIRTQCTYGVCLWYSETIARVTGGMKVKADRDEVHVHVHLYV